MKRSSETNVSVQSVLELYTLQFCSYLWARWKWDCRLIGHLLRWHFANFLIKWLLNKPRVKCNVLPRNIVCLLLWGVECESTKAFGYSPLPGLRLKWDTCLPTPAVCPSFLKMQSLVGTPPTGECRLTKLLLGLWYKWEEIPAPVVPTSSSINTAESKPSEKTYSNEVCDFFPCVLEWHKKYSGIQKMEK